MLDDKNVRRRFRASNYQVGGSWYEAARCFIQLSIHQCRGVLRSTHLLRCLARCMASLGCQGLVDASVHTQIGSWPVDAP